MSKPKKLKWEDETSYRHGERGKVEPRVWTTSVRGLRVTVHRLLGCDGWFGSCHLLGMRDRQLASGDLEEAKAEWFEAAWDYVASLAEAFEEFEA